MNLEDNKKTESNNVVSGPQSGMQPMVQPSVTENVSSTPPAVQSAPAVASVPSITELESSVNVSAAPATTPVVAQPAVAVSTPTVVEPMPTVATTPVVVEHPVADVKIKDDNSKKSKNVLWGILLVVLLVIIVSIVLAPKFLKNGDNPSDDFGVDVQDTPIKEITDDKEDKPEEQPGSEENPNNQGEENPDINQQPGEENKNPDESKNNENPSSDNKNDKNNSSTGGSNNSTGGTSSGSGNSGNSSSGSSGGNSSSGGSNGSSSSGGTSGGSSSGSSGGNSNSGSSSGGSSSGSNGSSGSGGSSGGSNNSGSTDSGTTEEEPKPEPTIVNTKSINLSNYSTDIKITEGGEYTITGTFSYTLYIEASSNVTLNLNGVNIKSKTDAAIANLNTRSLVINLQNGTTNKLSDGIVESEHDGCIFSFGDITINGPGTLSVYGNQIDGEGIATKNSPITINSGNISIYTVDDGLNTGGSGGTIAINGGNVYIEAGGDGVDSNQDIVINGGQLSVIGGSSGVNGGLDADAGIAVNSGTTLALGTEQLQMPDNATQYTIGFSLNDSISIGTIVTLLDENGDVVLSFQATDRFRTIIISSSKLAPGKYYLYSGGSNTGTLKNGIYSGGTYTKGEAISMDGVSEFVIQDTITTYMSR